MNNNLLKELVYIFIAILIGSLLLRFIIWILPIIIVGIISYYIYKLLKKNKKTVVRQTQKKKNKPIKIIDMETE